MYHEPLWPDVLYLALLTLSIAACAVAAWAVV